VFQWQRLIADGTAATAGSDTTEVEIGNVTVPEWARSILQAVALIHTTTPTTTEDVSGYFRIANDQNTIDPLNFPLTPAQMITEGPLRCVNAAYPVLNNVTKNDTIRVHAAMDSAMTVDDTIDCYLLFSSQPSPIHLHSQKSALTAGSDALTAGTKVTINTIAGKTSALLGIGGYVQASSAMTIVESLLGHVTVESEALGWLKQDLQIGSMHGGLTNNDQELRPAFYVIDQLREWFDGVFLRKWPTAFPISTKIGFDFIYYNDRDVADTLDPKFRAFLLWRE